MRDVAAANLAALEAVTAGAVPAGTLRAYNVGSGVPHTVGEMAAALAAATGGPAPVVTGDYRLGDVRHVTASSARARAELGWSAAVGFADGMAAFATAPLRAGVSTENQRPRSAQAPAKASPAGAASTGSASTPT